MIFDFFQRKPFGFNISDHSVELVSLGGPIERPKLFTLGREILEPFVVKEGKILAKEKLVIVLRKLIKNPQFGRMKTKKCIFSFPEQKSFIHIFELDKNFQKKDMEKIIKSEIASNFPFPLIDIYFDYRIINTEVILAACEKNILDGYLEVFQKTGLEVLAVEIELISLARAFLGKIKEETLLIGDMGALTTHLGIFTDGNLAVSISLPIGGEMLTQSLSKKLNISLSEAENFKQEIGLNPEKKEGKVFLILQKEIQRIIEEIQRMKDYFKKKTGKKIERVILGGGGAALPHVTEYLSENLEVPVLIGDPWKKINIDVLKKKEYFKQALQINPLLYGQSIGVALRGLMKNPTTVNVNLIKNTK